MSVAMVQRLLFQEPRPCTFLHRIDILTFSMKELRTSFDFGDHFYDPIKGMEIHKIIGERLAKEMKDFFHAQQRKDFLQPHIFHLSYREDVGKLTVYVSFEEITVEKENHELPSHECVHLSDKKLLHFLIGYCFKRSLEKDKAGIKRTFGKAWDRFTVEVKHDQ